MKDYNEKLPILEEVSFQEHKIYSLPVIEKYQHFNHNKAKDMEDCGRVLKFGLYENLNTLEQRKKLDEMYTCKDRFCPFCNWRRARKLGIQSYKVFSSLEADMKVRYISVTFTVKNCLLDDLSDTIKHMNKSYQRMQQTKRYKDSVLGHIRALEILGSDTPEGEAHPHYHCLFVVPSTYFNSNCNLYIKQEEWRRIWKKALRVDYLPQVSVSIIKSRNSNDPISSAVAETIKYPMKSVDLKDMTLEHFEILVEQMMRKRALAFGGIIKTYRKNLVLDDVEDGDLIYDDLENTEIWKKIRDFVYQFRNGDYGLNYYLDDI